LSGAAWAAPATSRNAAAAAVMTNLDMELSLGLRIEGFDTPLLNVFNEDEASIRRRFETSLFENNG
jgi:hypothetical protein